jgi:5-methyltetrahydrofolate--homocysteine methyltransferase
MIIIGEKINGSLSPVKKAILDRDADYIAQIAKEQTEAGATYLDVNAGTSPDREVDDLKWLINIVENTVETPLCIDSPRPQTLVDVLPHVKNLGLINSVSDESEKPEVIFPLVQKYNCGIIALTVDQRGIPYDAKTRVEITQKLISTAESYGIKHENIFIDPLVTALATNKDSCQVFTTSVKSIKEKYPAIKITSGLSNISYSLPKRKFINRSFLVMAIESGMDSAILDPLDTELMGILYATNALNGKDNHGIKYIRAFRKGLLG